MEFSLDGILEIMCENDFKRNNLAIVLYSFCFSTSNSHLRVLNRMKAKIGNSFKNQFICIVNDLLEMDIFTEEG